MPLHGRTKKPKHQSASAGSASSFVSLKRQQRNGSSSRGVSATTTTTAKVTTTTRTRNLATWLLLGLPLVCLVSLIVLVRNNNNNNNNGDVLLIRSREEHIPTKAAAGAAPLPLPLDTSKTTSSLSKTTLNKFIPDNTQGTANQLPQPVIVLSLPKSGTTSTQRYFNCALRKSASHHWSTLPNGTLMKHGECFAHNVAAKRPMLQDCGHFQVWTDLGALYGLKKGRPKQVVGSIQRNGEQCFFPALHGGLENIAQHYPNATVMMVVRDPVAWYQSAVEWNHGSLLRRMSQACGSSGGGAKKQLFIVPPVGAQQEEWVQWYQDYTKHIANFVLAQQQQQNTANATSGARLTYVQVSLESPDTAQQLQKLTGIAATCWGVCKPYPQDKLKLRRCVFPLLEGNATNNNNATANANASTAAAAATTSSTNKATTITTG